MPQVFSCNIEMKKNDFNLKSIIYTFIKTFNLTAKLFSVKIKYKVKKPYFFLETN